MAGPGPARDAGLKCRDQPGKAESPGFRIPEVPGSRDSAARYFCWAGMLQRDGDPARVAHLGRGVDAQRRRDSRGTRTVNWGFLPRVVRARIETEN